ncbi:App1 family protein [Gryllotalpicola ginsengisoli]|uniref:App1 family protein n=1 Tax=Gryllotalpicola ginsengisoli TaxID=444608 RepID=UPI0003B58278|nr:phosphatase domain-containing protein [Gryllotalpicola ginsengisoli]
MSEPTREMHRAARIDDAVNRWRARRARGKGYLPTVLPYAGYGAPTWARILGRVVLAKEPRPGSRTDRLYRRREESVRGWRSFTSVPVGDVPVVAEIEGVEHVLHPDRGGVIDEVIPIDLPPGRHDVLLRPHGSDSVSTAPLLIVDPAVEFGVVSDVDDTVMVTWLPRPLLAGWNTFVLDEHARVSTPGMAVLYERVRTEHPSSPFIYLSTGPWNVAPTLRRFLTRNLFPSGPLLLTDWGPTHDRFFRSGRVHKEQNLQRLAAEFPGMKWLLFGDDGQHDEEIYSTFIAQHPGSVVAVAIRQLYFTEAVLAGGRSKAQVRSEAVGVPWVYGPDGMSLYKQLRDLGIISARHDEDKRV